MRAATPATSPPREGPASLVAWGLVFWAGVLAVGTLLARSSLAAVALQAAAADWAAGRLGIAWGDRETPAASIARKASLGAIFGAALGASGIAAALLFHVATRRSALPRWSPVAFGMLVAGLSAVRDELFVRGLVLRATRDRLPAWASLAACGATTAAACVATDPTSPGPVAGEALRGAALGALWLWSGGAWMPCAANAAWNWVTGTLARGAWIDVAFAGDLEASVPVLVTLAVAAAIGFGWVGRRSGADGAEIRTRPTSNGEAGSRKAGYDDTDAPPSRPGAP